MENEEINNIFRIEILLILKILCAFLVCVLIGSILYHFIVRSPRKPLGL